MKNSFEHQGEGRPHLMVQVHYGTYPPGPLKSEYGSGGESRTTVKPGREFRITAESSGVIGCQARFHFEN